MMDRQTILTAMEAQGAADALSLRGRANGMDGTSIIAEEQKVPLWDGQKDYSAWPVGAPVAYDGQVYKLIQPHNAANYSDKPNTSPALWSICHTKDAEKAKAWMEPNGTSGMYMMAECYRDADGKVWRCKQDNMVYDAKALPNAWEMV